LIEAKFGQKRLQRKDGALWSSVTYCQRKESSLNVSGAL